MHQHAIAGTDVDRPRASCGRTGFPASARSRWCRGLRSRLMTRPSRSAASAKASSLVMPKASRSSIRWVVGSSSVSRLSAHSRQPERDADDPRPGAPAAARGRASCRAGSRWFQAGRPRSVWRDPSHRTPRWTPFGRSWNSSSRDTTGADGDRRLGGPGQAADGGGDRSSGRLSPPMAISAPPRNLFGTVIMAQAHGVLRFPMRQQCARASLPVASLPDNSTGVAGCEAEAARARPRICETAAASGIERKEGWAFVNFHGRACGQMMR